MTIQLRDSTECPLCGRWNDTGAVAALTGAGGEVLAAVRAGGLDVASLCAQCAAGDIPSPCSQVCELDERSRECRGCQRTLAEITEWPRYRPAQRAAVILRLRQARRETRGSS